MLIGIVPARSGSKRLPGKNMRLLNGVSLLARTITTAVRSGVMSAVYVSTDSEELAAIGRSAGARVPWLRSREAATETAPVLLAVLEVLDRLLSEGTQQPDGVILLQPTSPFRTTSTLQRAVRLYRSFGGRSVVSVRPARTHPFWARRLGPNGEVRPFLEDVGTLPMLHELPPAYEADGVVYVASTATLRGGSIYSEPTMGLITEDPEESIDIDTPLDWMLAECVAARREQQT